MSRARQAIVVIHGMGEQHPMDFLRGFVDAAIPPATRQKGPYSKPDRMSDSYELRRFLAPPTRGYPQTELYEYYWAHLMKGNELGHLVPMVKALLLRWPWSIASAVRGLWLVAWLLVGAIVWAAWKFGPTMLRDSPKEILAQLGLGVAVAAVIVSVGRWALKWSVGSFGDVARYLNAEPSNVAIRQKIRSQAVSLLRNLHESGRYQRILVVGHSLGSFVALDALRNYWNEVNQKYGEPTAEVSQEKLAELEDVGQQLIDLANASTAEDQKRRDELQQRYRHLQREVWKEIRTYDSPWLVTDFVSAGSPLAHAAMLMVKNAAALRSAQRHYELPRCPPELEESRHGKSFAYPHRDSSKLSDGRLRTLHDAALFACTRWTNIYYPSRGSVFGDLFAGPLAPGFGPGVVDRPVDAKKLPMWVPFWPHTCYFNWSTDDAEPRLASDKDEERLASAVGALREALDLESWGWLRDVELAREMAFAESDEERAEIQKKIEARE